MSKLRVVVLQSKAAPREQLHSALARQGMHVRSFASPLPFFDSLANGASTDLLLVDLDVDAIDGWRLCRLLRSPDFADLNALPILLTSSTVVALDLARLAQHLGAGGHLPLPAGDNAILEAVQATLGHGRPVRQKTALAVNNNDQTGIPVTRTLGQLGYNVFHATSLAEARRLATEQHPDVIVLDALLPDGRAQALIADWHNLHQFRQTVCVVITGAPDRQAAVALARHGAETCLHAPGSPPPLEKVVTAALQARAQRDAEERLQQKTRHLHAMEQALRMEKEVQGLPGHNVDSIATIIESVAHSFNNLLTPVLINAGNLRESFPQGSDELESIEEIVATSKRASGMIRKLALLGGATRPPQGPVDLPELITAAVRELRATVRTTIGITTEIPPASAVVSGHAAELKRALLALCQNAVESMPAGGLLTITLACAPEDSPGAPLSGLTITVSDTGPGVPPEIRDRVLEPFFTTKSAAGHAGLGLSMASSIMRHHGGHIDLNARADGHTHFALRFPPPPAPEAEAATARTGPASPGHGAPPREGDATILIVDDEYNIRHASARVLSKAGYTVIEAEDGPACLLRVGETVPADGADKRRIDLVLLDFVMPGMAGDEVLKALHQLRPGLPVVITSGHGDMPGLLQIPGHDARRVLIKPFEKDRLLQAVREILNPLPEPS